MMQLYIANKNYSSWSLRPWLVLKAFHLPFEEIQINFPTERGQGNFKQQVLAVNSNGKVPALLHDGLLVWDSLAICEYLAEQFPEQALWPRNAQQRAWARSICAEMHSGFTDLRSLCGMNIRANLAEVGAKLWQEHAGLRQDVARIEQIWATRPTVGGFLCGEFSIADAFYAPVVTRFMTYALPVSAESQQYMQLVMQHPAMQAWMQAALQEPMWVNYLEPYQSQV
ncbi:MULTISPECIES: glutathione S-transferase family protein [Acinetobacter]|jgi:glutathione S-transferase|uniref:glutathione S-transferase family protein n=1 Tax=Acinetobacter TaxID=469 RepID=UPI0014444B9D|nr:MULTISPECIES: glutathione S-transferase family protein [Acinetobacter]MBF4522004.1 glutathione S-transferase family protein [Acinetobacter towneri]MDM1486041.1 glutathione S-transferase family protein [Acinetobacter towneri]MEB6565512.1 glutathione S-transferase family protein [Acinetobacter towneri]